MKSNIQAIRGENLMIIKQIWNGILAIKENNTIRN